MKLPPQSDKERFPGALNRFDDFVAYHMTHAMELHSNYYLFGAHKYFLYLYEQALRQECGYTGYQPVRQTTNYLVKYIKSGHIRTCILTKTLAYM
jgi:tyrosinase